MAYETSKYWTESKRPPVDAAIARRAEAQHGVVSLTQLRSLGLSASAVRSRVASGRLHRVHRGVFAVGRRSIALRGRWMAAVLACDGVLSHRSALELWGAAKPSRRPPSVTTPALRRRRAGIDMHSGSTLTPADVAVVDGIPCTTIARTLLDFAEIARPKELARAVEETERLDLFDGRAVENVLARASGRRGAPRLRAALAEWREPAFTRSEAERIALALIEPAGLPRPNVNTFVAGHEVDLHWPEQGLVVEIDSRAFHSGPQAFERDAARDADLDDANLRVRRVTGRQLKVEPAAVVARIARALGLSAAARTPPQPRSAAARRSR